MRHAVEYRALRLTRKVVHKQTVTNRLDSRTVLAQIEAEYLRLIAHLLDVIAKTEPPRDPRLPFWAFSRYHRPSNAGVVEPEKSQLATVSP